MFSHQQRLFNLALAFTLTCGAGIAVPALAASTGAEIVAGIEKEHILAPGARVNARVDGSTAYLSTYRHTKANDTDLKVDAMLMSKVVMGLDSNISNVTVYFFSSADLTKYKQLTVSSVSVKAFGSGAVGKDELIGSLNLTAGSTQDTAARLANALAAGQGTVGHRVESAINGSEVSVSTDLDPDSSERDVKYAALQLAEEALQAAPDAKSVKIAFADLSQPGSYRQVVLDAGAVRSLNSAVKNALSSVSVSSHGGGGSTASGAASSESAMTGPIQDERQKLLDRINALGKNGVGVAPFLAAFKAIEQQVADHATVDSIADAVHRLSSNVDSQEKSYKDAKAKKASGAGATSGGGGGEPRMPAPADAKRMRWATGFHILEEGKIKNFTDAYLAENAAELKAAAYPQAEKDQRWMKTLAYFIYQLSSEPSKTAELASMKSKLYSFQQSHPNVKFE